VAVKTWLLLPHNKLIGMLAMAVQQQQLPAARFVDLPELSETFADSIHTMVWDGRTLRVEFCVTRFPNQAAPLSNEAQRYPVCRLVMTSNLAVDLFNRLQQTMTALAQAGVVQKNPPIPPPA
jgi:hypothetical protein